MGGALLPLELIDRCVGEVLESCSAIENGDRRIYRIENMDHPERR